MQCMKVHAGYALRLGVTRDELKEVVYLTTVTAGFPRAIDAAQALREVPDPAPR
ncbi:carboxymuconolactone decarboxylase family protein [Leclercia adecarboxylata]|uniref:carboxymuconolactone decarboxylase family protein n=1 Tax=Leclercia adecarboxylata TaxID=83655 RepID=UPI0036F3B31C